MTSFAVNYGLTPAHSHASPKGYSGLKRTPQNENISFGSSNGDKINSGTIKNLLIATGLLLAAATGIAAYILTKGKKKPANIWGNKTDTIITNLEQAAGNQTTNKLENIIKEFKEYNKDFADLEPIVTKLKNGKQKLEFKYVDKVGFHHNQMIILDKAGNFEKRLVFQKGNGLSTYVVHDGVNAESKWSKAMTAHTQKGNKRVIKLEKPGGWQKEIVTKSNDKVALVSNQDWCIPYKVSPEKVLTTEIYKNPSTPADVRQYTYGSGGVQNLFAFKPGETKVQVSDTFDGLSSEQIADMRELILGRLGRRV